MLAAIALGCLPFCTAAVFFDRFRWWVLFASTVWMEGDEMMKFKRGINICSCWHANGARPNGIASRLSPPS